MASIVAPDDFALIPYSIANLNQDEVTATVQAFIDAQEKIILTELFGATLYNQYIVGIAVLPTPDQKWVDLRDGAEYDYLGKTYRYQGLKSLLVPRIYSQWLRDYVYDAVTSTYVAIAKAENAEVISPGARITNAWVAYLNYVGNSCDQKDTLYGFLNANPVDYADWFFSDPGFENDFDL